LAKCVDSNLGLEGKRHRGMGPSREGKGEKHGRGREGATGSEIHFRLAISATECWGRGGPGTRRILFE